MKTVHGEYKITLIENIIYARFTGGFNEFALQNFDDEVRELVASFCGKPFAMLINDIECHGGTPEAFKVLEIHNKWLNTQQLVAKAMVIHTQTTLEIIDMFTPSRSQQNIQNFTNDIDALEWLRSNFEAEPTAIAN